MIGTAGRWDFGVGDGFWQLTTGQRFICLALAAYAAQEPPETVIGDASIRTLAEWADVSTGAMHKAVDEMLGVGLLKRDDRRSKPMLEFAGKGVQNMNTHCSGSEHEAETVQNMNTNNRCSEYEQSDAGDQGPVDNEPSLFSEEDLPCSEYEHQVEASPDKESLSRESLSRLSRKSSVVTSKDKKEVLEEALEEARAELESQDQRRVEQFAIYWAEENSTAEDPDDREPTLYRRVWAYDKLLGLLDDNALEAWRHGMDVVLEKPIPNVRYAMKVMQGYEPGGETIYDQPSEKKPERYNPTDETIVGWENLEGEG